MSKNFPFFVIPAVICFIFCSCSTKEYQVDNAFAEYINRFEKEAKDRRIKINLRDKGLIMDFGNLGEDRGGVCYYENPIRIVIDRDYWEAVGRKENGDLLREELIFHELGHGFLKRAHDNGVLENDEWKSIMCGGDKVGNRPWISNYKGEHRRYYIDELFRPSISSPDFALMNKIVNTSDFYAVADYDFESSLNSPWALSNNTYYNSSLVNGQLRFQSRSSISYLVFARFNPMQSTDFTFNLTLRFPDNDNVEDYFGLILGVEDKSAFAFEYFRINNDGMMQIGNSSWYGSYCKLNRKQMIKPRQQNRLKIIRKNHQLFYFINDKYAYSTEMELPFENNIFGFMVPPHATVYIDNFQLASREYQQAILHKTGKDPIQFHIEETDSLSRQDFINNQAEDSR